MSYEGYVRLFCSQGHKVSRDCYESEPSKCDVEGCGSPIVYKNYVDTTNGSYCDRLYRETDFMSWDFEELTQEEYEAALTCTGCDECNNGRIDGYEKLEVLEEEKREPCKCCGQDVVVPARYKLPEEID